MATPRSEPYFPGGPAMPAPIDVSASNPVASAIAGVGMAFVDKAKRLKEEKQASQDRLALTEFRNQSRIADMEYGAAVENATSDKEIDAAMEKRAASLNGFLSDRDVSEDVRKRINADSDFFRQESYILAESSKARLQARKERAATETAALDMASSGDLQGALLAIEDSPAFADDEKIRIGGQLRREFDRVAKEQYATRLSETRAPEEIDAVVESLDQTQASELTKESIRKMAATRKKTVAREDYSFLSSQISLESQVVSRIERGDFFTEEEIDALNVDDTAKRLIKQVGKELKPGLNQYSQEYKDFVAKMDSEFSANPWGSIGAGEVSAKQFDQLYSQVENGPWDTSAKMGLLSKLMQLRAIDAKTDKDLEGFFETKETAQGTVRVVNGKEISIDDGQARMLRDASLDLSSILARSDGKIVANRTGMSYMDFTELFFDLQSEETIAKFKDLDPESQEYRDRYNEVVGGKIADRQKRTAIQLLRDRILGLREEQARLRGEIADGQ